jgi:hypothetical protein
VDYAAAYLQETLAEVDPEARRVDLRVVAVSGPRYRFGEVRISGLQRYSPELVERFQLYRQRCRAHRLERNISTRVICRAYNWMLHGKDLEYADKMIFAGWRKDEITKVKGA